VVPFAQHADDPPPGEVVQHAEDVLRDGVPGWQVQDGQALNLFAGQGIAVREVVMAPGHGRVDYLLYVDRQVVGVIQAKPVGTTLSGVEWQSSMYATGLPEAHRRRARVVNGRMPFVFEASGTETHFTNGLDPDPRARRVFSFPQPATLARFLREAEADPDAPTWRAKVRHLPVLDEGPLRPAQVVAIRNVERSLAQQRFDRSLVQMATGAGKTFAAVTLAYRLSAGSRGSCSWWTATTWPTRHWQSSRTTRPPMTGAGSGRSTTSTS
jgi:type I restriction enzyme, R subunit